MRDWLRGGEVAYLRNQNGVVIKVTSTSQGLRLRLASEGIKIALES
jgi:transaldolase